MAGHMGLDKLIYLYDDNEISIDGSTDLAFTEDVDARFEAYGWHVQRVTDGNDLDAVDAAIRAAKDETDRPSLISVQTHIGYGSPNQQDTAAAHGSPLGEDEVRRTKRNLGWPEDKTFFVPDDVRDHMQKAVDYGAEAQDDWDERFAAYEGAAPDKARAFTAAMAGDLPDGWIDALPTFEAGTSMATRASSGKTLDAIGPHLPMLIGGSADLTGSNKTDIDGRADFQKDHPEGQYFRFGVREHGMAGAANGMVLHGGVRPYVGTFLIFSDYLRPSLRLSALMEQPVIYVFTHDSIGLGEDGPTHQPIEHLMALRAIPNCTLIRPADANETAQAWRAALDNDHGPTALVLTRQGLPTLDRSVYASADGLQRGAYVLSDDDGTPDAILVASGSEVQHIAAAAETLRRADGLHIRVVSMPSWALFDKQPDDYKQSVFPDDVTVRLAVEAGRSQGWERYVGLDGRVIGIDRFGASAPGEVNMAKFGFTAEDVVDEVRAMLG
jgi:transketolase